MSHPTAPADSLELVLTVPARARAGTIVPIRLLVRNRTERTVDLYLRGRSITFDVAVSDSQGGEVWRRLEGEVIPAIVHLRALPPGEALELETEWNQRASGGAAVAPGAYVIRGYLLVEGTALESRPVSLRIDPE